MIRINLLPRRRRAEPQATASQAWAGVLLVAIVIEAIGLLALHSYKERELKAQERKNLELMAQIEQSKKAVANHPEVLQKLSELRARESAITALQTARSGPTAVLLEVARILTNGRGPTVDSQRLDELKRENPLAVFSASWDPRRLWLTRYIEQSREVQIGGFARDGEDVSEFARRLGVSSYFENVRLMPGRRSISSKSNLELVEFELQAKARY